jgi:hypothetical protein
MLLVRNCAISSSQISTTQEQAALKVVNKKIAALARKRAWRQACAGTVPDHAKYPEHPLNN